MAKTVNVIHNNLQFIYLKLNFDFFFALVKTTENYNSQFWDRLQNEWKQISDDKEHPWLTEFSEYYDPYKVIAITLTFNTKNNY